MSIRNNMDTTLAAVLPKVLLAARHGKSRISKDTVAIEAFDIRAAAIALGDPLNVSTQTISRAMAMLGARRVANGEKGARYAIDVEVLARLGENRDSPKAQDSDCSRVSSV